MGQPHNTRPDNLIAAERALQAMELRKHGFTYDAIGKEIGVTRQRAYQIVKNELEALREECSEIAEDIVKIELERLDIMLVGAWPNATTGDVTAIDRVLKIMERRARLLGLDAPAKVAPTTPDGENPYEAMSAEELRALAASIAGHESQ